jgi:ADP-dependent NAD(P)H-hydrate dehydratase / NAD(P)H-hydrate epimerase
MERVVSAEEMKWCDETTIKGIGIPGLVLMENAGGAVARSIGEVFGDLTRKHLVVFCGKGNNGGDGFVAARHLSNAGAHISIFLTSTPGALKGDALTNYSVLKKISGRATPPIAIRRYSRNALDTLHKVDGIVDAVFGTGFAGKIQKPLLGLVEWINNQEVPIFSVDVPSGLNATTGLVENLTVRAQHTITFGLRKSGLLLNSGKESCGTVTVADIGIPKSVAESKTLSRTFLIGSSDVEAGLPRRALTAHKYGVGKVFVIAGSRGLTGAAALCATSALRAGAGAVLLGTPEAVYPTMMRKLTEVMVMPLPSTDEGTLSDKSFDVLQAKLAWADVVVVGPGLSRHPQTQSVVHRILKQYAGRILLDADGLFAVGSAGLNLLKKSKAEVILTPHSGEFGNLVKKKSDEVDRNRIEFPRSLAKQLRQNVILKGAPSVVATADGTVYLNSTGNPGMATIGSGDVLSGIIAALWAQGCPADIAAYSGVYLHGLAGDLAKKKLGERSLIAGDIITFLPEAFSIVELKGVK